MKRKIRFIDCGANIGQSIEWARKMFKDDDLLIDSFEPLPMNIVALNESFPPQSGLTIHEAAVSNRDGEATFFCQNRGARTGSSLIEGKTSTSRNDTCVVKTIDLAQWVKNNIKDDEIAILKLDIEGAEYEVIPHLLQSGIHKIIDYWLVGLHGRKSPNYSPEVESNLLSSVKVLGDWSFVTQAEETLRDCGVIK